VRRSPAARRPATDDEDEVRKTGDEEAALGRRRHRKALGKADAKRSFGAFKTEEGWQHNDAWSSGLGRGTYPFGSPARAFPLGSTPVSRPNAPKRQNPAGSSVKTARCKNSTGRIRNPHIVLVGDFAQPGTSITRSPSLERAFPVASHFLTSSKPADRSGEPRSRILGLPLSSPQKATIGIHSRRRCDSTPQSE